MASLMDIMHAQRPWVNNYYSPFTTPMQVEGINFVCDPFLSKHCHYIGIKVHSTIGHVHNQREELM